MSRGLVGLYVVVLCACGGGDAIVDDGGVDPTEIAIGGTVSGLAGSGLVLRNGGEQLPVAADGSFTFATRIASGATYSVEVTVQPMAPPQVCSVARASGTAGDVDVTDVAVTCATETVTIGGTVIGLVGSGLVLRNNGGDELAVSGDGPFLLATPLASGSAYEVTVATQPTAPPQTCTVEAGSGTANANVTSVVVRCETDRFTVGGTVVGPAGQDLVLRNNDGDDRAVTMNGGFTFATAIAYGEAYAVTAFAHPTAPWQTCAIATGVVTGNISDVAVTCTTDRYKIGGTVTGLVGTERATLRLNGART